MILKLLTHISRVLVGLLFIYSGFVKLVDPIGSQYKFQEYFSEGVLNMEFLIPYTLPFAILLIISELVFGVMLLVGYKPKLTVWSIFSLNLVFLFLTWYSYTYNKVTDCGCFGDFLKLKPIETFVKDIIYTILSLFLVFNTGNLKELFPRNKTLGPLSIRTIVVVILIGASTWFCFQNFYLDKPMVDFRPFAEGIDMKAAKEACDADVAIVETIFTYNNSETGKQQLVNSKDIMKFPYLWEEKNAAGETIWKADKEKTETKTIHEGCNSQIQYFRFDDILNNSKYNFLVVGGNLDKSDKAAFKQISAVASAGEKEGYTTKALYYYTDKQTVDEFRHDVNGAYDFSTADDKLLKTIVRANPGLVLLKDGKVIKKWHHKHIPTYDEVKAFMN